MEEAAFIKKKAFFSIIAPLLNLTTTVWLSISTPPTDRNSHFDRMMKMAKIKVLEVSKVCATCKRNGIKEKCKHVIDFTPPWQSDDRRKELQDLFGKENEEQFARENEGMNNDPNDDLFPKERIAEMFSRPPVPLPNHKVSHVFVAVDPCVGSNDENARGSDYAVVSIIEPGVQIVGMECMWEQQEGDIHEKIIKHCDELAKLFPSAILVVAFENQTGREHTIVLNLLQQKFGRRIIAMREPEMLKAGLPTTNVLKHDMQGLTRKYLSKSQICFTEKMVTQTPDPAKMLDDFQRQLRAFRRVIKPPKDDFGKVSITYSGKAGNCRDDMAICLQLAIIHREKFFENVAVYGKWHI